LQNFKALISLNILEPILLYEKERERREQTGEEGK